jgi:hypothetical protein
VGSDFIIVFLYVDELIFMSTSPSIVKEFKSEVEMFDLGEMQYFLGMQIKQTTAVVSIGQSKYVEDLLKRFNMHGCKPVSTPSLVRNILMKEDETPLCNATLYRSLIESLMYLRTTRLDIMFVVSLCINLINLICM